MGHDWTWDLSSCFLGVVLKWCKSINRPCHVYVGRRRGREGAKIGSGDGPDSIQEPHFCLPPSMAKIRPSILKTLKLPINRLLPHSVGSDRCPNPTQIFLSLKFSGFGVDNHSDYNSRTPPPPPRPLTHTLLINMQVLNWITWLVMVTMQLTSYDTRYPTSYWIFAYPIRSTKSPSEPDIALGNFWMHCRGGIWIIGLKTTNKDFMG